MNTGNERAERFAQELESLKLKDPAGNRTVVMLRLSIVLMVVGIALGVVSYFVSHGTTDPLAQRDAIVLALLAVTIAVVGGAVYLRFALTNFFRFWLARQTFDLHQHAESVTGRRADL